MTKKAFLIILDGWGHNKDNPNVSAIKRAQTPFVDSLYSAYPHSELITYGKEVGLPEGQMGNSEVGHLNIGAGRIVHQALAKINNSIESGDIAKNPKLLVLMKKAKEENKAFHLIGLLSDGGVHSHIEHLKALCTIAHEYGVQKTVIHAFLDGRDTSPQGGVVYLNEVLEHIQDKNVSIGSVIGRYYAMDRDSRWERTQKAYDLLVNGKAEKKTDDPLTIIKECYADSITDEFMKSILVESEGNSNLIKDNDVVLCFNFRTDRPRQISTVLTQKDFPEFGMKKLNLSYGTMTNYDKSYNNVNVIFDKEDIKETLGEVVAEAGLKQLRIAETEKYPHVTYFFNGGREAAFENEHRIVIKSPDVATYDLQPDMNAYEVTNAVHHFINDQNPELIILNYANADMVGHTGMMDAAVKAVECLDACLESLIPIAIKNEYRIILIADHGNSDIMINEDGSPHTAHTTNMVPCILIDPSAEISKINDGKLADIAPTILEILDIEKPEKMDGTSLINKD